MTRSGKVYDKSGDIPADWSAILKDVHQWTEDEMNAHLIVLRHFVGRPWKSLTQSQQQAVAKALNVYYRQDTPTYFVEQRDTYWHDAVQGPLFSWITVANRTWLIACREPDSGMVPQTKAARARQEERLAELSFIVFDQDVHVVKVK